MGIDKALTYVTNTLDNFDIPYNLLDISLERAVISIDTAKLVELFYMGMILLLIYVHLEIK